MNQTTGLAIFGFACTILGAAIGIVGSYFVAIRLARNHAKTIAGLRLRDAFAPEFIKLQTSEAFGLTEIPDMLKAAFPKHKMAVDEFMFSLKGKQLDAFDKIWREYYCDPDEETPKFIQYCDELDPDHQIAIKRIQAIRKFTKN